MLDSSATIQKALDVQSTLASNDLKRLFTDSPNRNEAYIEAYSEVGDNSCFIYLQYPIELSSQDLEDGKSLRDIHNLLNVVHRYLLPLCFGQRLDFIDYILKEDIVVTTFRAEKINCFLDSRTLQLNNIQPVPISDAVNLECHEIVRRLDFILSNSELKHLYRIPATQNVFERLRLRETVYSIDFFKSKNNHLIRLMCIYPSFYKGDMQPIINKAFDKIQAYTKKESDILEVKISSPHKWRTHKFIEVRLVV